ncbi:MAG: acylphosphatase [Pyrinomonadaceae bacterium]|nr:acylphosphatase [Pyrinomonadaceae bacterium]MCX7639606.1 acylphosphatase [Pyrinomonadaceae bacterium]MDW8303999.1 acylphosphatase [Acidobacteriota bacterium]
MARVARKFIVKGKVQGVGYRFFTYQAAIRHGIVGYVKNLKNGDVEVVAEGDESEVLSFKKQLFVGPPFAVVREIEETVLEATNQFDSFKIER